MTRRLLLILGLAAVPAGAVALTGLWRLRRFRRRKLRILSPQALRPTLDHAGARGDGPTVYLIGDSQIAHWPLGCRANWNLYRSGFAGEATPNIAAAVLPFLPTVKPDAVVVISGGNDVSAIALLPAAARDAAIRRSAEAFRALRDAARAAGARVILFPHITANPRHRLFHRLIGGSPIDAIAADLNGGVAALCGDDCRVVALAALLGITTAGDWAPYVSDGLHLNPHAFDRLSRALDPIIVEALRNGRG